MANENQNEDDSCLQNPHLEFPILRFVNRVSVRIRKFEVVTDVNLLFTTAIVMGALYDFLNLCVDYSKSDSRE